MVSGINGKTSAIEFFCNHKSSTRSCCNTVPKREESCLSKRTVSAFYTGCLTQDVSVSVSQYMGRKRETERVTETQTWSEREGRSEKEIDRR